jgi:hypothetical protein
MTNIPEGFNPPGISLCPAWAIILMERLSFSLLLFSELSSTTE